MRDLANILEESRTLCETIANLEAGRRPSMFADSKYAEIKKASLKTVEQIKALDNALIVSQLIHG